MSVAKDIKFSLQGEGVVVVVWTMIFKGPFQSKPFYDSMISAVWPNPHGHIRLCR